MKLTIDSSGFSYERKASIRRSDVTSLDTPEYFKHSLLERKFQQIEAGPSVAKAHEIGSKWDKRLSKLWSRLRGAEQTVDLPSEQIAPTHQKHDS